MNKGFSLIELLVAVSIISVVFGVIISSSQAVQKQGRDTQRQADLRNVQGALQHYYADQGFYPQDSSGSPLDISNWSAGVDSGFTNCDSNPNSGVNCSAIVNKVNYLNKIPTDPSAGKYYYKAFGPANALLCGDTDSNPATPPVKCVNYCLYALMEATTASSGLCNGYTPSSMTPTPNFWITQP